WLHARARRARRRHERRDRRATCAARQGHRGARRARGWSGGRALIAVVSGGGRGIGRAIAFELADRGCDVAVLGRTQETLASAAEGIVQRGRRALAIRCDVSRSEDVDAATSRILAEL